MATVWREMVRRAHLRGRGSLVPSATERPETRNDRFESAATAVVLARRMIIELGFDTIGNATVIAYDQGPILATDPWIGGAPYFGSWALAHEIPTE